MLSARQTMSKQTAELVQPLASRLKARFGREIDCRFADNSLLITVPRWPEAALGVTLTDAAVPHFAVSYPAERCCYPDPVGPDGRRPIERGTECELS